MTMLFASSLPLREFEFDHLRERIRVSANDWAAVNENRRRTGNI
jgi:hypothetical protein